jgi:ribosomal protein S25
MIAYGLGCSVKKCINDIKIRGRIIDYMVKNKLTDASSVVNKNLLFSSIVNKYEQRMIFNKFKNSVKKINKNKNVKPGFKHEFILNSLCLLNANSKKSAVTSKELFKSLDNNISRSSFNKLLNNLESDGVIKTITDKNKRKLYLSKDMFKFLKY